MYPNPTNGALSISFSSEQRDAVQISVTDLLGKTLFQQQTNGAPIQTARLDVADLPAGVYYVSLNNGRKLVTEKFIKK